MINKTIRLGKAFLNETIKRLPYVIALLIIIGGIGAMQSYRKTAESVRVGRDNSEQVKSLTLRIKKLSEENHDLNEQTRNQSFCFVKAFAVYTQTGNPVTLEQIISCNPSSAGVKKLGTSSAGVPHRSSSASASSLQSKPQSVLNNQPSQSNSGQPGQGNGDTMSPRYTNCVRGKQGLFDTLTGVINCL